MRYLHCTKQELTAKGALFTAMEIEGQPALWKEVYELILQQKNELERFLFPVLSRPDTRIILTGAGSSAYIGEAAQGIVQLHTNRITNAIATTDLITHPRAHFLKQVPTLLVSFARSGNSPESMAAVELANEYCNTVYHLVITCNKDGALLQTKIDNTYHLVLPEKANDKSLAMTGSFTAMLLSVVLLSRIRDIELLATSLHQLTNQGEEILQNYLPQLKAVADKTYQRVIFLGSGPLLGIARECHLKLQELTDGKVVCKHDSFLGFRHGPRAVTNEQSLIVYLLSSDEHVFRYEHDLCLSIDEDKRRIPTVCYNQQIPELKNAVLTLSFRAPAPASNELAFISATLIGQLLGFYQSLYFGLQPDNPSVSGAISRVVQGVVIYPEPVVV